MQIDGTIIEDTYAEAFDMWACRLIVTAVDASWAGIAGTEATGYGTSIIGCDCEAGIERGLQPAETPDGRPGVSLLFFARKPDDLIWAVTNRTGQCLLTCPTTAVFNGTPAVNPDAETMTIPVGKMVSYFGDGHQRRQKLHSRDCWEVPVMDGWFVVEDAATGVRAVGGGNLMICGADPAAALRAAQRAVEAIRTVAGVIAPFPGGVVRCGSKVGSRYSNVPASTNDAYCPVLRDHVPTKLRENVACVYEIVIDGLDRDSVAKAMRAGVRAACGKGVVAITAGNYGGKLGKTHLPLREILEDTR